jgi:hypothetical protein
MFCGISGRKAVTLWVFVKPSFESEFAKYKFSYPEGGPESFEYQIPQNLIFKFNDLTQFRTDIAFGEDL